MTLDRDRWTGGRVMVQKGLGWTISLGWTFMAVWSCQVPSVSVGQT